MQTTSVMMHDVACMSVFVRQPLSHVVGEAVHFTPIANMSERQKQPIWIQGMGTKIDFVFAHTDNMAQAAMQDVTPNSSPNHHYLNSLHQQ